MRGKEVKGAALLEVIVAIAITIAVTGFTYAQISKSSERSNITATANAQQTYSNGLSEAMYDLGVLDTDDEALFLQYVRELSTKYLGCGFDETTVTRFDNGFTIDSDQPNDAFGCPYTFMFCTKLSMGNYVLVVSGGPNLNKEVGGYSNGDLSDDIVTVCKPKTDLSQVYSLG